jgi:hypothetical protein
VYRIWALWHLHFLIQNPAGRDGHRHAVREFLRKHLGHHYGTNRRCVGLPYACIIPYDTMQLKIFSYGTLIRTIHREIHILNAFIINLDSGAPIQGQDQGQRSHQHRSLDDAIAQPPPAMLSSIRAKEQRRPGMPVNARTILARTPPSPDLVSEPLTMGELATFTRLGSVPKLSTSFPVGFTTRQLALAPRAPLSSPKQSQSRRAYCYEHSVIFLAVGQPAHPLPPAAQPSEGQSRYRATKPGRVNGTFARNSSTTPEFNVIGTHAW